MQTVAQQATQDLNHSAQDVNSFNQLATTLDVSKVLATGLVMSESA